MLPVNAAISQHQDTIMLHIAAFTGIWGVSFLIWLAPALLIAMFARSKPAYIILGMALLAVITASLPIAGRNNGPTMDVAAIQAGNSTDAVIETPKIKTNAVIAVWPEILLSKEDEKPKESATENKLFIVTNYIDQLRKAKPYNAVAVISPDGKVVATAMKHHLFGRELLEYSKGEISQPTEIAGCKAGLAICYDTVFTDVCRTLAKRGAEALFVPNCDPDVPNSLFARLHSALIAFRAAENGIPIVWANGYGLSAIFDGDGVPVARAPEHGDSAIYGTIHLRKSETFYTRIGDYFAYLCAGFSLLVFAISILIGLTKSKRSDHPVLSEAEQGTQIM
jgi:apolipoprotein N-acyltransferase